MIVRHAVQRGRVFRCLVAVALALGASTVGAVTMPASAHAQEFAPAHTASIHPGVVMDNPEGQCTANFVFKGNGKLYLGQAAHCTGTGSADEVDGCTAKSLPLGTEITIQGASKPGKLAYSSWITMRERGETDPNLCQYNDFALVEIDPADEAKVNPTVPTYGGPVGLREVGLPAGAKVYSYQNSSLRLGLPALSPKEGVNLGDNGDGRTHEVATLSPGVPGDSGSGFLDSEGRAVGVLSTLNLAPAPGTNGVTDLAKALEYANRHAGKFTLVRGTEPFRGGLLPSVPLAGTPSSPESSGDGSTSNRPPRIAPPSDSGPTEPIAVNPRRSDPVATGRAPELPKPASPDPRPQLLEGN